MNFIKTFKIIILFSLFNACELQAPRFQTLKQAQDKLKRKVNLNKLDTPKTFNIDTIFPVDIWSTILSFLIRDLDSAIDYQEIKYLINLRLVSREMNQLIYSLILKEILPTIAKKPVSLWLINKKNEINKMQEMLISDPYNLALFACKNNNNKLFSKAINRLFWQNFELLNLSNIEKILKRLKKDLLDKKNPNKQIDEGIIKILDSFDNFNARVKTSTSFIAKTIFIIIIAVFIKSGLENNLEKCLDHELTYIDQYKFMIELILEFTQKHFLNA